MAVRAPLRPPVAALRIRPAATLAARRLAPYRVVGSAFAHVDVSHVLYNVAAAAAWLPPVEAAVGPAQMAALLAALAVVGHAFTTLVGMAVAAVELVPGAGCACIVGASGLLFGVRVVGGSATVVPRLDPCAAAARTRQMGGGGVTPGLPAVRLPALAATVAKAALALAVHSRASAVGHAAGIGAGLVVVGGFAGGHALAAVVRRWWAGTSWGGAGAPREVAREEGVKGDSSIGRASEVAAASREGEEGAASGRDPAVTACGAGGQSRIRRRRPHAAAGD